MVDFQNPISLNSSSGTVQVNAGSAPVDAQLTGILSGTGGLTIAGYGPLDLTASNTYTGPTTVSGPILRLSNSAALPGGTGTTATGPATSRSDGGVIGNWPARISRGTWGPNRARCNSPTTAAASVPRGEPAS